MPMGSIESMGFSPRPFPRLPQINFVSNLRPGLKSPGLFVSRKHSNRAQKKEFLRVTSSEMVVVWVMPPPVAVMVTVLVPVEALLLALKVTVELPDPGAAIEVGLKVAVTPDGRPLAEREIAELKPPATV